MDYKVLLLILVLAIVANGQSTTVPPPSTLTSKADQRSTAAAEDGSTEIVSTEDDDLKPEGSSDRFTFTEADALKSQKLQMTTKPGNDLEATDDDEDPIAELTALEELLTGIDKASDNDETINAKPKDMKSVIGDGDNDDDDDDNDEDDDDSDEDGESNPKSSSDTAGPLLVSKPDQFRRQGDLRPGYGLDAQNTGDSGQPQEIKPDSTAPVYLPAREQGDTSSDGSPLLQLTQGGYQRPYQRFFRLDDQQQRMRSGSAPQQSETLEAPRVSGVNGDQAGPLVPQVEYTTPYQPQFNLGARPAFQHHPGGFGTNGILPNGLQNGFFSTPPAGFTDFSSANFQSQFHPADNGGFSAMPRDQNGFVLFQTSSRQNPGSLFQGAPQYPQSQPMFHNHPRSQDLFHPGSFSNFPNLDIVDDTPRPNYSPYMRHPAMPLQFPNNPNFFGTLPNSGINDFNNPGINLLQNYPGNSARQSLQPQLLRYPVPDSQITLQSSDQVEKQKQDPAGDLKTKDSDVMKASQDKEDPASAPFGARIKQNNAPDQNDLGQKDVYLRYPVREAGYATEENLPVQNTTEKTVRNTDSSPANPPFPFFTSPDEFRPFSNPDPYRNALNAFQQSYANTNRNTDDSNQSPVGQLDRNAPVQFDDRLVRPPNQLFPSYRGNQEVPIFQNRPFYPVPGVDGARNPFYPGVPENRNLFAAPGPDRNEATIPTCAQNSNASVCFEDTDYPRRELQYALNSNSFLMERLSSPNAIVEKITLNDQKASDDSENEDNSICKSDIKYGLPLRAKNVQGTWKVIVNLEDAGSSQFMQPVRMEICRAVNQPCSFTQVKTECVQKYNLHRLLSWSAEKGIHADIYKLPVACSCQIVDAQA